MLAEIILVLKGMAFLIVCVAIAIPLGGGGTFKESKEVYLYWLAVIGVTGIGFIIAVIVKNIVVN